MNAAAAPAAPPLKLGPELTIVFAADAHRALADAVPGPAGQALVLDLGDVTDFDSAGVQLLLAVRRSLAAQGRALCIARASEPVLDALTLFGLQPLLPAAARTGAAA